MKDGQGFARRVTLANLAKLSPLLRKTPIPTEANPPEKDQEKPDSTTRSAYIEASKLFRGKPLRTKVRFKKPAIKGTPRVTGARKRVRTKTTRRSATHARRFVITLQETDVGFGQKTKGASKRSPEIFVPLGAVREQPEFWGWPDRFVPDPKWTKKKDRDGRGKMDRSPVKMRLRGETLDVHWWYNPDKIDIRLRNSKLRKAGKVGDIIRIDKGSHGASYDYGVRIIRPTDSDFKKHLALCSTPVRKPSKKRYGYF